MSYENPILKLPSFERLRSLDGGPDDHLGAGVPWTGDSRNRRSVWTIPTSPFPEAHFATFSPALVEPCILATCPEGGTVLDPFLGSGTTAMVARRLGRRAIGIDLNPDYLAMAVRRMGASVGLLPAGGA